MGWVVDAKEKKKKPYRFDLVPVLGFAFLSNPWAIFLLYFLL